MANEDRPTEREICIARVLRPLGTKPMTRSQAVMAGKLLGLHWTSVYRLWRRFLGEPVASSLAPKPRGPRPGELAFNRPGNTWLLVGRIGRPTIDRLSRLARVDPSSLAAMQGLPAGPGPSTQLAYCPSCLFLNPLDVTSPCWKHAWLAPSASNCAVHAQPLTRLSITALRTCDNFDKPHAAPHKSS